jgi:hypothetical protein
VEVASNTVIDESLSFGVPLTLHAASGYSPQLALDRGIAVSAGSSGSYAVEGFTLQRGVVNVSHAGGNVNVLVRRIRVLAGLSAGTAEISLYRSSSVTGTFTYEVAENELHYAWDIYDGALRAALQVLAYGGSTAGGRIHDNRIDAGGSWGNGILLSTNEHSHTTRIDGNWIRGGNAYGSIDLRLGNLSTGGSGNLVAYVINNIVTPLRGSDAHGIAADVYGGSFNLQGFNNTVTGAYSGFNIYGATGTTLAGRIANNLLAGNTLSLAYSNGGSGSIGNDHNLLFGGSLSGMTAGAGTITTNPQLRGAPMNPWLSAGSPAIDAADSVALSNLLASAALARVDGAGLRRFKGAANVADIGALEYGDNTFLHRVNNAAPGADNFSTLDAPSVNAQPARWPQLTANWNPFGGSGIYDNQPISASYNGLDRWYLRTEDLGNFPNGASFDVFAPADGSGNFRQVVSAATISGYATQLFDPALTNACNNRILLATRDSKDPSETVYDDTHPFAVFCFGFGGPTAWFVSHSDSTEMLAGGGYHIYFQEPSANAFVHTSSDGNRSSDYTVLDHPLLNGRPCARPHVTQAIGTAFNPHQIGVFYSAGTQGGRWAIYNQDLASMPADRAFHVVVDAQQAYECSDVIFADGFGP